MREYNSPEPPVIHGMAGMAAQKVEILVCHRVIRLLGIPNAHTTLTPLWQSWTYLRPVCHLHVHCDWADRSMLPIQSSRQGHADLLPSNNRFRCSRAAKREVGVEHLA